MKINSINNATLQQNKSKTQSAPTFTSILPIKVSIDGCPSADAKNIKRVLRQLSNILFNPQNDKEKLIRSVFAKHDRSFSLVASSDEKGNVLRNYISKNSPIAYLFTGSQAQALDEIGRQIGKARAKGKRICNTTRNFEAQNKAHQYFNKIMQLIHSNQAAHMCETIDSKRTYRGKKLGLQIEAKSQGVFDKKGFKIMIDRIIFRKIEDPTVYQPRHRAA